MVTTMRKIGNSIGIIIPSELKPQPGTQYKVVKVDDTFVITPIRDDLFAHPSDWDGFRKSVTEEDREWDEMES